MTLNEEVARALGWTNLDTRTRLTGRSPSDVAGYVSPVPDFEHDWNAVYRWIVPAVKEMKDYDHFLFVDFVKDELLARDAYSGPSSLWPFDASPEDYCRALLKVKGA